MSTLIYHTGALGDFITTIPAIQFYKKQNTDGKLTLLGRPAIGKFAQDIGLFDSWLDVDNKVFIPLFYNQLSDAAKKLLQGFSAVILFTTEDSPILHIIKQSGIKTVLWQPPFPTSPTHVIDYHLSLFCDTGTIDPEFRTPHIKPSGWAFRESEKIMTIPSDNRPIAIHPGSGSKKKNWAFENFLSIADYFRAKDIPVLWIKGPAEESLNYPARDSILSTPELPVLAAALSQCRCFIGNDSGVTHLAAAVDCPTVAIFGPGSDSCMWAPMGRMASVISCGIGFSGINVETVVEKFCSLS